MRDLHYRRNSSTLGPLLVALALSLVAPACVLDDVDEPPLGGPSDQGLSVRLFADPDVVNADGVSQVVVTLVLIDQNGEPVVNKAVEFWFTGDGQLFPSTDSTFVGPIQSSLIMATDSAGTARVVYVAGTAITNVTVFVRPYGIDAANGFYRWVRIWQT